MLDQKTKQILSGFPQNVPVASNPSDPMNKLVTGAYSTGLRFIEHKLQQSILGRFPVGAHLTDVREVCSTSPLSKFINPIVYGVNSVGTPPADNTTTFALALTEEDFLYGKPTAAHNVRTQTVVLPTGYTGYDVSGLAYTRPDSTQPGKLHYLINTWSDDSQADGRLFTQEVSTEFENIVLGATTDPEVFQSATQSYDTVGYDTILSLVPTDADAGTSSQYVPVTTYTAALQHGWVSDVVIYDIGNLDANGNAIVVSAAEYTVDSEAGEVTFNVFISGSEYIARPSYIAGTQGDPGWNSTYMAEYSYNIYKNAFGLSPLNYVQDTGNGREVLLSGMTPNSTTPKLLPCQQSSYSFTDKAISLSVPGYELNGYPLVYVSCIYTNVLTFTWLGADLALTDYVASSSDDLPTIQQQMLGLYDAEVGCNLVKVIDGVDQAIETDGFSVTGQTWGSVLGSLHIDGAYVDVGTEVKLYYKTLALFTPTPVQGTHLEPPDYTAYTLIDHKSRKYALVDKLLNIATTDCTDALAEIITTLDTNAYRVVRGRIINGEAVLYPYISSTAYDPYKNVIWATEDGFLVAYSANKVEFGRWPLLPYTEDVSSEFNYPYLSEYTGYWIETASICFWRRWLLVAYRYCMATEGLPEIKDQIGIIDTEYPELGITPLSVMYTDTAERNYRPLIISPCPNDTVAVIRSTPANDIVIDLVKLDFNYYWVLDNKMFLRNEIKSYDKLRVVDNGVTTDTLQDAIATEPIATGVDNMLNILGMSRIEGYGNEEDVKRAGALLKYTPNSTHQGLVNALYSELIMSTPPKVNTTTIFTLSKTPITIDTTGVFYPIVVTSSTGAVYGTQGINMLPDGNKPTTAEYIYDALGNVTTTWDWLVWLDQASEYTRHFEFRIHPPMALGVAQRFNVTYYIKNTAGTVIQFTETFFPETERATTQPVWIGLNQIPYAVPLIGLWGLNDKDAMRRIGFLDSKSLPTSKLLTLVKHQDSVTRLRWGNGEWNFTCWTNVAEQVKGLEYIPCRFDVPFVAVKPISNPDTELASLFDTATDTRPALYTVLLSPGPDTIDASIDQVFTWTATPQATSYALQISTSSSFATCVVDVTGIAAATYTASSLEYSAVYYWRVRTEKPGYIAMWSTPWMFTTVAPIPISLLHFDGADGSTVFTDESGKVWSRLYSPTITTAESVFGGASGRFQGAYGIEDRITSPYSADWDLGTGDFTIDFRFKSVIANHYTNFFRIYVDALQQFWFWKYYNSRLDLNLNGLGVATQHFYPSSPYVDNVWYHIELVRHGGYLYCFTNGAMMSSPGYIGTASLTVPGSPVAIIQGDSWGTYIDEFRVIKGFAAHTANFTPPAAAYTM